MSERCGAPIRKYQQRESGSCARPAGHGGAHFSAQAIARRVEYKRERYANDPDYRERAIEQSRAQRATPKYAEMLRERYATDPDYRELKLARHRNWAAKNPLKRYLNDQRRGARNRAAKMEALTNGQ